MDDLEFRRTLYADPNCTDEKVLKAAAEDPKKQAFLRELKQLNKNMQQASQIDVPNNLASKLILRQTMQTHAASKKRNRMQLALAASVAFIMGVSFTLWQQSHLINITEQAIAHVRAEGDYALKAQGNISLEQVNAKLARFGGELSGEIGQIYYANYCDFNNIRSLHMVIQLGDEKLTVFVVPNNPQYDNETTSHNEGFEGQAVEFNRANLVVVGEEGADVAKAKQALSKKFKFST